jgi:phosphatidate cytidylyltransferase
MNQQAVKAILALPIVLLILWQGGLPFSAFIAIVCIIMGIEWIKILSNGDKFSQIMLSSLLLLIALASHDGFGSALGFYIFGILFSIGLSLLLGMKLSLVSGGFAYIGAATLSIILLRSIDNGLWLVFFVFWVVWATDVMAYVFGKTIGGPKLAPVISPNKTWAGLLGGVIGAAIIGAAISFFLPNTTVLYLVVFGSILAVISQIGDLFESSLKRKYDVKDSGVILPGHGGMLDRLDGMLAVVIAVFLLLIARSFDKGLTADAVLVW